MSGEANKRPIAPVAIVAIAAICAIGVAWFAQRHFWPAADAQNLKAAGGILFVNETADHRYDRALRSSLRYFQNKTGVQLGIVLKAALPAGKPIESFSVDAFQGARIGEAFNGRGILFVWSEQERLFKIEVSYALEGVFPDAICRRLEDGARTFMLNKSTFARRDFLTELIVTMGIHYIDYQKTGTLSPLTVPDLGNAYKLSGFLSGGAGIVGHGYAASVEQVQQELVPLPPALVAEMQPDADAQVVVARYMKSLELGIGAADLPLLTEGSRYFRLEKAHSPGYLKRIRAYQRKAMPFRFSQQGDLAGVTFQAGHPVLPILLRRDVAGDGRGRWYVDEAGSWAYFHLFEDAISPVPKYDQFPYRFTWEQSAFRDARKSIFLDRSAPPPLRALPFDLRAAIAQAEADIARTPASADAVLHLAELLHFEMYWLEAAAPLYEKVLSLDPDRVAIRWRLMDVYINTTDIDGLERQYVAILKRLPEDALARWYYDEWFKKAYW